MKALTMRLHRNRLRIFLLAFALLGMVVVASPVAHAATLLIVNNDGAGEGFNDPTAVAAVGGNTGTTVGAQRLIAFQHAADIWGGLLASSVTIRVGAQFNPLTCSASSAVLGSAGPTTAYRDFTGAPVAATWYPIALANALNGSDLNAGLDDISATFSSTIGTPGCLTSSGWYYGLDATPPSGKIDFVSVLEHELAHGLGFLTFVNLTSGAKSLGFNDTFMRNLEDHGATPSDYPSMSDAQRVTASRDTGNLHWVGANVMAASAGLSAGTVGNHVRMYAPNPAQSGSSVSHWDTALTPNQIMEPSYTGALHNPALELPLFQDIGWTVTPGSGTFSLTVTPPVNGTVTGAGINCPGTCSATYGSGTSVSLTATPASGFSFGGWGGDCAGQGTPCSLTMNGTKNVTATFTAIPPPPPGVFYSKLGVFRNGTWFLDRNGNGAWDVCGTDGCIFGWGAPGDLPVVGDWTGTGTAKLGVFRNGDWFFDRNGNGVWDGCGIDGCVFGWGSPGDLPVAGDWTGTGTAKLGVFRNGDWFFDLNGSGVWDGCGVDGCILGWGAPGDIPVAGDWTGTGTAKLGVFRNGDWFFDLNGNGAWDGCGTDGCVFGLGAPGDSAVAGRW